jgi:hypothetical protein
MPDQLINIPAAHFEELAAAPLKLAQAEAEDMLRRGDVVGANRKISEGVARSAGIRAQALARQAAAPPAPAPAAPPAPAPAAPPAPEVPRFVQNPRNAGEAMMADRWQRQQQQRAAEGAGSPTTNMRLPMGLGRPR